MNDPIYGFISIHNELIFDIIDHRYFQRLRRIRQLGITDMVYPGAVHSRFHHALGAMHLMGRALQTLKEKGFKVSEEEYSGALIAILLHDVGHGPFSHSLEYSLFPDLSHESLSEVIIKKLNVEFDDQLALGLEIFQGTYKRKFLNQLVSSQLDVDRLDYLMRDSFFTGVQEGKIGSDRIIKMLSLVDDELVIEEKGIYSIENFLSSRRLMYWQVYLHKTAVSADVMLIELIKRARKLIQSGKDIPTTPALSFFLQNEINLEAFSKNDALIETFTKLDDSDIWGSIKFWREQEDFVLSKLSQALLERKLFAVELTNDSPDKNRLKNLRAKAKDSFGVSDDVSKYFVRRGTVSNAAYIAKDNTINILTKSGNLIDVAKATDLPNIKAISKIVKKHYLCYPKELSLLTNKL